MALLVNLDPGPATTRSLALSASDMLFAVSLAVVSTTVGYRFASGNQLEQLPIILRHLDPGYLPHDPFVTSGGGFGPRYYFAWLVAALSAFWPVAWTYLFLRFAADLALALVTIWGAVRIVGADPQGARVVTVLTLVVSAIHLGDAAELRYYVFQPASLSIPAMLLAIGLGFLGRPIGAGLAAALASVAHPLYGVYGGAIGLACAFFTAFDRGGASMPMAVRRTVPGVLLFAVGIAVLWVLPSRGTSQEVPLSTTELFEILGRFRSPHHYLPREFRRQDYVILAVFVCAIVAAWRQWRTSVAASRGRLLLVPILFVAVGCVAGTVFTEVWPVGAILTLQPFRLLSVLKWIGFLLLGRLVAEWWRRPPNDAARPAVALSLVSAGAAYSLVTAAGLATVRWRSRLGRTAGLFARGLFVVASAVIIWRFAPVNEMSRLLACVVVLIGWMSSRRSLHLATMGSALVLSAAVLLNRTDDRAWEVAPFRPTVFEADLHDPDAVTARAAAAVSEPSAVFIAPPQFGILRVVGRRALVVDFEAIPFGADAMREWRRRIHDVYGEVGEGGHRARAAMERAYRRIGDEQLIALGTRYGATHAVLFAETPTGLPVLYGNAVYRIVQIGR